MNCTHGARRTNDDKRRAVERMLHVMRHPGENWSDREIARRCAVHHQLVGTVRASLDDSSSDAPTTRAYVDRWGNTSTMHTANIGQSRPVVMDVGPRHEDDALAVDPETGEILDDEPPPFEEVDPSDPTSFLPPPRPTILTLTVSVVDPDDCDAVSRALADAFVARLLPPTDDVAA